MTVSRECLVDEACVDAQVLHEVCVPQAWAAFIDAFTGPDRYVLDYLCQEVVARLPPDLREFLLRTSILPRLSRCCARR